MKTSAYFSKHRWLITLLLTACAAPVAPIETNPGPGKGTFTGDALAFQKLVVSSYCGEGGDQDNDSLCDQDEDSSCVGKQDCDGDGVADGNEDANLDKNPMALAATQLGSIATAQVMADPTKPDPSLMESLNKGISVATPAAVSSKTLLQANMQQAKKPPLVVSGGGSVDEVFASLRVDKDITGEKNGLFPNVSSTFDMAFRIYYKTNLKINNIEYSNELVVLHCLGSFEADERTGNSQKLSLFFKKNDFTPMMLIATEFSGVKSCGLLGQGIFIGFITRDGGIANIYRQIPKYAGFRLDQTGGKYGLDSTITATKSSGSAQVNGFYFESNSSFGKIASRSLYVVKETIDPFISGTGCASTVMKKECTANTPDPFKMLIYPMTHEPVFDQPCPIVYMSNQPTESPQLAFCKAPPTP